MTEKEIRNKVVSTALSHLGCKQGDASHKKIIDIYNSHSPLARGYKVTYTDAWCATFVSSVAIQCDLTDIIPTECSCTQMISLLKKLSSWQENDAFVPNVGDLIFYDWQDTGVGDNVGAPDHVGIVEKVNGSVITVIEGNYSNSVKRRTIQVNGRYIRGYGVPKYSKKVTSSNQSSSSNVEQSPKTPTPSASTTPTPSVKVEPAMEFKTSVAGTYTTTADLNLRSGAGTNKTILVVMPKGTRVYNYGYFTKVGSVPWYYVQVTVKSKSYTGFCSSNYLKKA